LLTIRDQELYKAHGYDDFPSWVASGELSFGYTGPRGAWIRMRFAEAWDLIESLRSKLPEDIRSMIVLPETVSQIEPLFSLTQRPAELQDCWFEMCQHVSQTQAHLSAQYVKDWLQRPKKMKAVSSLKSISDMDFSLIRNNHQKYTAEAQAALDRIGSLCGRLFPENFLRLIQDDLLARPVTPYDLEIWNRHNEEDFIRVGRLVLHGLSVAEADRFALKSLGRSSTITEVIHYAVAGGGKVSFPVDQRFKITVEPL
jgi:hypothetical protein